MRVRVRALTDMMRIRAGEGEPGRRRKSRDSGGVTSRHRGRTDEAHDDGRKRKKGEMERRRPAWQPAEDANSRFPDEIEFVASSLAATGS